MSADWTETMNDIESFAKSLGLEFHEVRNAWGQREIDADRDFYKDQGVTCSDMNHMLYGAYKSQPEEVDAFIERLARDKRDRQAIVDSIAATSGQAPELVLQQLREFFAPILVGESSHAG